MYSKKGSVLVWTIVVIAVFIISIAAITSRSGYIKKKSVIRRNGIVREINHETKEITEYVDESVVPVQNAIPVAVPVVPVQRDVIYDEPVQTNTTVIKTTNVTKNITVNKKIKSDNKDKSLKKTSKIDNGKKDAVKKLKSPDKTQKQFDVRDTSKKVKSGGFGKNTKRTIKADNKKTSSSVKRQNDKIKKPKRKPFRPKKTKKRKK